MVFKFGDFLQIRQFAKLKLSPKVFHYTVRLVLVVCIGGIVMEGTGVDSAGCIVHVDVHGATQMLLSMADVVSLVCRSCGMHKQYLVFIACWSVSYIVKFYWC